MQLVYRAVSQWRVTLYKNIIERVVVYVNIYKSFSQFH